MKTIETLKELNDFLKFDESGCDYECVLRVYDNKSDVLLQTVVVKHPIIFIRGLQEFCKSVSLPVSDVSVHLVGYISLRNNLLEVNDICEISPFIYFKKPEEIKNSDSE